MDTTPQTRSITLLSGNVYELQELSIADILDFEEATGRKFAAEADAEEWGLRETAEILWILVRRTGVSNADAAEGRWAIGRREFFLEVQQDDLPNVASVVRDFLSASRAGSKP